MKSISPMHGLRFAVIASLALTSIGCGTRGTYLRSGPGPEDLEKITIGGREAIVTGTARRSLFRSDPNGEIQIFHPGDSEFKTLFKGNQSGTFKDRPEPFKFQPAGICYLPHSNKYKRPVLYATNHALGSIEIFGIEGDKLVHLDHLKIEMAPGHPCLKKTQANAVAAFPDGSVYASVFAILPKWSGSQVRAASQDSQDKSNTVLAYNPRSKQWRRTLVGFNGCNGLAAGPGDRSLLVAELHSKRILSFERDPKNGELSGDPVPLDLDLKFHPDNIKRTAEGSYEITGANCVFLSGLELATGIPCSPGGWVTMKWDGKEPRLDDHSSLLYGHNHSPSTTITFGDHLYSAQPISSGVFVAPLP